MDLPSEVFARVFEIGVLKWGIHFLPPVRLTCRDWNQTVLSTPRLYGVVNLKLMPPLDILSQLRLVKSAPLHITLPTQLKADDFLVIKALLSRLENWVHAAAPLSVLALIDRDRDALRNLDALHLHSGTNGQDRLPGASHGPQSYWRSTLPRLRFFSATALPSCTIEAFLVPTIVDIELHNVTEFNGDGVFSPLQLLSILQRVPNVTRVQMEDIKHLVPNYSSQPVSHLHLSHLTELHIIAVRPLAFHILSQLRVPALRTLVIRNSFTSDPEEGSWQWVFIQWSEPEYVPTNLHTLDISGSLIEEDVPFMLRWLERLPHLKRLFYDEDFCIARALGSDAGLCSSLRELSLQYYEDYADLVNIARGRSGTLKLLAAPFCEDGGLEGEVTRLVDVARCTCFTCMLSV